MLWRIMHDLCSDALCALQPRQLTTSNMTCCELPCGMQKGPITSVRVIVAAEQM